MILGLLSADGGMMVGLCKLSSLDGCRPPWYLPLACWHTREGRILWNLVRPPAYCGIRGGHRHCWVNHEEVSTGWSWEWTIVGAAQKKNTSWNLNIACLLKLAVTQHAEKCKMLFCVTGPLTFANMAETPWLANNCCVVDCMFWDNFDLIPPPPPPPHTPLDCLSPANRVIHHCWQAVKYYSYGQLWIPWNLPIMLWFVSVCVMGASLLAQYTFWDSLWAISSLEKFGGIFFGMLWHSVVHALDFSVGVRLSDQKMRWSVRIIF